MRLLRANRLGFAFTSDLSAKAILQSIVWAQEGAAVCGPDVHLGFPSLIPSPYPNLPVYDDTLPHVAVADKIERALAVERAARTFDRRVTKVRTASYRDVEYQVALANSRGLEAGYQGTQCSSCAYVVAEEEGSAETGWEFDFSLSYDGLRPWDVGERAAERAVRMLHPRTLRTSTTDILLDPSAAAGLLEVVASALTAEAIQKCKSPFAGKVGQPVATGAVTVVDDGRDLRGITPAPCDGEGVPTQKTLSHRGRGPSRISVRHAHGRTRRSDLHRQCPAGILRCPSHC